MRFTVFALVAASVSFADEVPGVGTGRNGDRTIDAPAVVNRFAKLANAVAAGSTSLDLDVTGVIEPRELVVLFVSQLSAAPASDGDTAAFGDLGRFTFARVASVSGRTITLDTPLESSWPANTQAVVVPEFENLTVTSTGRIEAPAWNGDTGGLAVFLVRGRLQLDGAVSADARGFRGGAPFDLQGTLTGGAGEGFVRGEWPQTSTARPVSSGGAPGSLTGPGTSGGGGGNSTRGGFAPYSFHADTNQGEGGIGGLRLPNGHGQRLVLGGGAAACRLGTTPCGRGGTGGGAILIHAHSLDGAGFISANGTVGTDKIVPNRGWVRGSGGAGGSIVVRVVGALRLSRIDANGADGTSEAGCCSAGGAGGAGRVFVNGATVDAATSATSGISGLIGGAARDGTPTMHESGELDRRSEPLDLVTPPVPKLGFQIGCSSAPGAGLLAVLLWLVRRRR